MQKVTKLKCHTDELKHIAKGQRRVFVELFKKNEVSNLSKYTVHSPNLSLLELEFQVE